jgi:hypothetical protein
MSAIGRPLRGTAAQTIDSGRRHAQLDVGLVGVLRPREKAPCVLERPCRAVEEDPMPGLYPRGGGKFPPEGSKCRIFGCFREELPPRVAGASRCAEYVKR